MWAVTPRMWVYFGGRTEQDEGVREIETGIQPHFSFLFCFVFLNSWEATGLATYDGTPRKGLD